jgi:hypothetical protein
MPGTTPLLVKWMLDHTLFLSLRDLGKVLPPYMEVNEQYDMGEEHRDAYRFVENTCDAHDDSINRALRYGYLTRVVNTPFQDMDIYGWEFIVEDGVIIDRRRVYCGTLKAMDAETILSKEQVLIDTVRKHLAQGQGVGVFVQQTGEDKRDYQPRLKKLIEENVPGAKACILRAKVDQVKREQWIEDRVAEGHNVLICNPALIQEGLDLLDFPVFWWHELTTSLPTLLQASRRAWRIPQIHPCAVYFPIYNDTVEAATMAVMARKMKAHYVLNGDEASLGDDLAEGGNVLDEIMAEMRRSSKVDLQALFAEMNALYSENARVEVLAVEPTPAVIEQTVTPQPATEPAATVDPIMQLGLELGAKITVTDVEVQVKVEPEEQRKWYWQRDLKRYGEPMIISESAHFPVGKDRVVMWYKLPSGEYMRECHENKVPVHRLKFESRQAEAVA